MKSTFLRTASKVGICTGAILAVSALGAATASAAVTYTVKAGTTVTGTAAVTGATTALPAGGNQIVFVDTTKGQTLGCAKGAATGTANLGSSIAGAGVGTITKTTWTTCTGPGGIALTPKQVGTWKIAAAGATKNGVTRANVTRVKATITGTGCAFTVTGAATGTYNNATGLLKLAPLTAPTAAQKLTVSATTGCFGAISDGDNVTFTGNYKLTSPSGAISILSN